MKTILEGIAVETAVREGTHYVEIIKVAREVQADCIVMATHGCTGLAHVLIGSVAEAVVRMAPCPVLTVKLPGHDFVMP